MTLLLNNMQETCMTLRRIVDAVVMMTGHSEYSTIDFKKLKASHGTPAFGGWAQPMGQAGN